MKGGKKKEVGAGRGKILISQNGGKVNLFSDRKD